MLQRLEVGTEAVFEVMDGGDPAEAKPRLKGRERRDGLKFYAHWRRVRRRICGGSLTQATAYR